MQLIISLQYIYIHVKAKVESLLVVRFLVFKTMVDFQENRLKRNKRFCHSSKRCLAYPQRDNTPLNLTILFIIFPRQSALAKNGQPTGLTRPVSAIFQTILSVDIRFLENWPSPVPILGSNEIQLLSEISYHLHRVRSVYRWNRLKVHQNVFHLGCCRSDRFYCGVTSTVALP